MRNPLSQNPYIYGYGDPVNLSDDSGKNPILKYVLQKGAERAGPLLDKGVNVAKALFRLLNGDGDPTNEIKAAQAANDIKIGKHILKDLSKRGWTKDLIKKTIQKPARKVATKDIRNKPDGSGRVNDPATAYIREDGSYVVRNDKTGDIVQISNRNDPSWKYPW